MGEEVHLHVEGDSFKALDAVARGNGMSRTRLALGLVWEAWKRDVEGIVPPKAELSPVEVDRRLQHVMTSAVRMQGPGRTHLLHVVDEPFDADTPLSVASALRSEIPDSFGVRAIPRRRIVDTTARDT